MWSKSRFATPAVATISFCLVGGTVPAPAYADLGDQLFKLLADDGAANDLFGFSVAISGASTIIGAHLDDDNGSLSGSAYLFDISDPANPVQIAKLLPDDGAEGDWFGFSVAISGATAIVGAYQDDDNGSDSGSAYLFDISDPANPVQTAKLLANDGADLDQFGISVAISGATGKEVAIVGAHHDDDNGNASGSAYLFDAGVPGMCPWDLDANGTVGVSDLLSLLASWGPCKGCPADFDDNDDRWCVRSARPPRQLGAVSVGPRLC